MKLFSNIYEKVIELAKHRHAEYYLGGLSFAESSFFPIPPDVMLMPMSLARPERWVRYAFLTTIASVLELGDDFWKTFPADAASSCA